MTADDRTHDDTTSITGRRLDRRTVLQAGAAAAGLAATARLAGPASAQNATPAGTPAPSGFNTASLQVSGPVEIEYWQYELASKTALVNELIPEFQAANPGITVRHVNFPYDDFRQQVAAAVQAGEGPDVLNVYYGWIPAYVQQQFLVPFPEDIFPAATIESAYFPMVQAAKVGESYYALPTAVRTLAMFCNMDLLNAAGVQPPTNWEETVAVAKATTVKNGDTFEVVGITWDIGGQGHNWWREALTRQNGLVPYTEDNRTLRWSEPEGVEAFEYLASFLTEHDVTQSGFQTDGATAFAAGLAALHVDGSYRVGSLANDAPDLNYAIVPLPANKEQASFASFWANTITRNAAEGDKMIASAKFIEFLSSEEVMRRWTPAVGELPARQALAADPALLA
ncbi:MAG: extracellular solute-binding protein, partial [Thermomicrobiales bacterium]